MSFVTTNIIMPLIALIGGTIATICLYKANISARKRWTLGIITYVVFELMFSDTAFYTWIPLTLTVMWGLIASWIIMRIRNRCPHNWVNILLFIFAVVITYSETSMCRALGWRIDVRDISWVASRQAAQTITKRLPWYNRITHCNLTAPGVKVQFIPDRIGFSRNFCYFAWPKYQNEPYTKIQCFAVIVPKRGSFVLIAARKPSGDWVVLKDNLWTPAFVRYPSPLIASLATEPIEHSMWDSHKRVTPSGMPDLNKLDMSKPLPLPPDMKGQ